MGIFWSKYQPRNQMWGPGQSIQSTYLSVKLRALALELGAILGSYQLPFEFVYQFFLPHARHTRCRPALCRSPRCSCLEILNSRVPIPRQLFHHVQVVLQIFRDFELTTGSLVSPPKSLSILCPQSQKSSPQNPTSLQTSCKNAAAALSMV